MVFVSLELKIIFANPLSTIESIVASSVINASSKIRTLSEITPPVIVNRSALTSQLPTTLVFPDIFPPVIVNDLADTPPACCAVLSEISPPVIINVPRITPTPPPSWATLPEISPPVIMNVPSRIHTPPPSHPCPRVLPDIFPPAI